MCSAQSAKTLTILVLLAWVIAEDPGPILWVTANGKEATKFARSRVMPFFERVKPVADKFPPGRGNKNLLEIYFPGAPFVITGAESKGALQQTPYRYLFLDEVRSYPAGALEMAYKRTRSFSHNYKVVTISTPDEEQDPMHRAYLDGDQNVWHVRCMACGVEQPFEFGDSEAKGGMKFDTSLKLESGDYDHFRIAETISFNCEACGHEHRDTPEVRKRLCSKAGGRWVKMNPGAPKTHRSFHYSALLPHWNPWARDVEEWLKANRALVLGDPMPLKSWVNETAGRPWTSEMQFKTVDRYIYRRKADYDVSAPWEDESRRFMTVDVQGQGGRHYYAVVRAWATGARSRLLLREKVWTIEELRRIEKEYQVKAGDVAVDIANWTAELVQNLIVPFGWRGLRGDEKEFFVSSGPGGESIKRIWDTTLLDPAIGTKLQGRVQPIKQFLWSKPRVMEILNLLMHGQSGDWRIFKEVGEEYCKQVTAWSLRPKVLPRNNVTVYEWWKPEKRWDHYASCEHMQVACAAIVSDGSPVPILGARGELPLFQRGS
jgi:hypothetical protein